MLYISNSNIKHAGRGVFAGEEIKTGNVIEACPVIELPNEAEKLKNSKLYNYYFLWSKNRKSAAIALGYGSLYNHSYEPNATYVKDKINKQVIFKAIKDIKQNEEITVNYNYGNPDDKSPLWIKSIKVPKN